MGRVIIFLMALLLFSAVQLYAQDQSPTGTPHDTLHREPDRAATPSANATVPALTKQVMSQNQMLMVHYPEEWTSNTVKHNTIVLVNNPDILQRQGFIIPQSGEVYLQVSYVKRSRALQPDGTVNLGQIWNPISNSYLRSDEEQFFSEPETLEIHSYHAAHTLTQLHLAPGDIDVYALAVDQPEHHSVVVVNAITHGGESWLFIPTIQAIAAAVQIDKTAITPVVAASRLVVGDFSVQVPHGWYGQVEGENGMLIASAGHLLDGRMVSNLQNSDVLYLITLADRAGIMPHDSTLAELAYTVLGTFGDDIKDGLRLDFVVNGHQATGIAFTADERKNAVNLYYLFIDFKAWGKVMVLVGMTRDNDIENLVATALEIAQTVSYEE